MIENEIVGARFFVPGDEIYLPVSVYQAAADTPRVAGWVVGDWLPTHLAGLTETELAVGKHDVSFEAMVPGYLQGQHYDCLAEVLPVVGGRGEVGVDVSAYFNQAPVLDWSVGMPDDATTLVLFGAPHRAERQLLGLLTVDADPTQALLPKIYGLEILEIPEF